MKIYTVRIFLSFLFFFLLFVEANAEDLWNLQGCIDYAVQNNPELQAAEANIKVSTYGLDYQKKLFFPRLDLNTSTGFLEGEPTSSFAVIRGVTEEGISSRNISGQYISAALTLSIPVFREGVLFSNNAPSINKVASQILLDKSSYEAKKNELAYNTGTSFFNLLKNKEDIKTSEEQLKYSKLYNEIARAKYKEELISKNDLLLSEVKLASAEKELTTYRNLTQVLMADLSIKMGLDPAKPITISEDDFILPVLLPLDKLFDIAISSRHEIKEQEMRISMANEEQRLSKSQRYPDISIVSSYSVANDYGSHENSLWNGMLQLNMPVFDFGAITSKIKSQEAKVAVEEKLLLSIKGNIIQKVITAFININNAMSEIALKEKTVEQSMENTRLVKAQFEQNLLPLSSVLDAEYILYANKKALSEARYNLRLAYLELLRATASNPTRLSQQ
ncbi:MAG: TolC family protein [Bacteroidetes bacterium]|nr:MAG: TolC family protein [Bacteroidota bacterium]